MQGESQSLTESARGANLLGRKGRQVSMHHLGGNVHALDHGVDEGLKVPFTRHARRLRLALGRWLAGGLGLERSLWKGGLRGLCAQL